MKILINASNLRKGGGVQVGNALIHGLCAYPKHNYLVVCTRELALSLGNLSTFPSYIVFKTIEAPCTIFQLCKRNIFLNKLAYQFSADIVFTVFGPPYWRPLVKHICGYAKPQFVYPESPFFQNIGIKDSIKQRIKRFIQLTSFRRDVDVFITETQDVSMRLRKLISKKNIYTVSNSCNPVFAHPQEWISHPLPPFDGITLLTISAYYSHKNLCIIPRVAEYLHKQYPNFKFRFVVTQEADIFGYTDLSTPEWLLPIGKVNIRECPSLYEQCNFMFLPTLLECFSASYVEAMRMKRPILTSNLSFARELCGDAAEYFNPLSEKDIGETIYRLSNNQQRQRVLVDAGIVREKKFLNANERTEKYIHIIENEYANKYSK